MTQRGPLAAGTMVQLRTGGPLMVVEDTRSDRIVATVWFEAGEARRDAFDLIALRVLEEPRE